MRIPERRVENIRREQQEVSLVADDFAVGKRGEFQNGVFVRQFLCVRVVDREVASLRVDEAVVFLRIFVFHAERGAEPDRREQEDEFSRRDHHVAAGVLRPFPDDIGVILEIRLKRFQILFRRFEKSARRPVGIVFRLKNDGPAQKRGAFQGH